MPAIYVGGVYPYAYDIYDSNGNPISAATIALKVTAPDLTFNTYTPTEIGTGHYTYNIPLLQEGQYRLETITSSPTTADGETINARTYRSILSMGQAKAHLNVSKLNTMYDDEIREMNESATSFIESFIGPCVPRIVVERVRVRSGGVLALSNFPVISLTSVLHVSTEVEYLSDAFDLDRSTGIVHPLTGFYSGYYDVEYIAGRTQLSANFVQAAKEMLWHMWTSQRGSFGDTLEPSLTDAAQFENAANGAGLGFTPAMPARVRELLKPSRVPGLA